MWLLPTAMSPIVWPAAIMSALAASTDIYFTTAHVCATSKTVWLARVGLSVQHAPSPLLLLWHHLQVVSPRLSLILYVMLPTVWTAKVSTSVPNVITDFLSSLVVPAPRMYATDKIIVPSVMLTKQCASSATLGSFLTVWWQLVVFLYQQFKTTHVKWQVAQFAQVLTCAKSVHLSSPSVMELAILSAVLAIVWHAFPTTLA